MSFNPDSFGYYNYEFVEFENTNSGIYICWNDDETDFDVFTKSGKNIARHANYIYLSTPICSILLKNGGYVLYDSFAVKKVCHSDENSFSKYSTMGKERTIRMWLTQGKGSVNMFSAFFKLPDEILAEDEELFANTIKTLEAMLRYYEANWNKSIMRFSTLNFPYIHDGRYEIVRGREQEFAYESKEEFDLDKENIMKLICNKIEKIEQAKSLRV